MNINDALIYGRDYLLDVNLDNKPLKIRLLLEHILKMNKFELVINHNNKVEEYKIKEFEACLKKLKNNTPIQYITNNQEFMKMNFYVDENVLIPQPDTEILVENVINFCSNSSITSKKIKILDLCTGSGAIAISLAKYIENCEITATDISFKALQIAKLNAENNLVHTKINFIESDMFSNILDKNFDIIVSNPPYIETSTISALSLEVQKEPYIALNGGFDGLNFYKIIIKECVQYLKDGGKLFLEIGYNQKEKVFSLLENSNYFTNTYCVKDLGNNDRVIISKKNSK